MGISYNKALVVLLSLTLFPFFHLGNILPANASGSALCLQDTGTCDSLVSSVLSSNGFSVTTSSSVSDLSQYDVVVIAGLGSAVIPVVPTLKNYVSTGGGLVFLSGNAYWLQQTDHNWLGFGSAGYTGSGESATVSVNNPFGTSLAQGAILKQQGPSESGAQYVNGVTGTTVGTYSGGGTYAYYASYGDGKIYYQADTNPSSGGSQGESNIREILGGGINFVKRTVSSPPVAPFDFNIAVAQSSVTVLAGSSYSTTLVSNLVSGSSNSISVSASGLSPSIATITLGSSSMSVPGTTSITISVPSTATPGTYTGVINGVFPQDGTTRTAQIQITVQAPQPTDSLPAGTTISSGSAFDIFHNTAFPNSGAQSYTYPNPPGPVKSIYCSVTSYVQGAVLSFNVGGVTHSKSIAPNSNTILTFANPLDISNIKITIQGRGYANDQANVSYKVLQTASPSVQNPITEPSPQTQADLIIVQVSLDNPNIQTNSKTKIAAKASNIGNAKSTASNIVFYVDGAYFYEVSIGDWHPGGGTIETSKFWTYDGKPHTIKACIDAKNSVSESNEGNNCQSIKIGETLVPDYDNDGIVGNMDKCPNSPEDFDGYQDSDGCPEPNPSQVDFTMELSPLEFPSLLRMEQGSSKILTLKITPNSADIKPVSLSCLNFPSSEGKCLLNNSPTSIIVTPPTSVSVKIETGKPKTSKTYEPIIYAKAGDVEKKYQFYVRVNGPQTTSDEVTTGISKDNYSIDIQRSQAYSKTKGEIIQTSLLSIDAVRKNDLTATFQITNKHNAKYAVDVTTGCIFEQYTQTMYLKEKETKTISQTIPKHSIANKDAYCIEFDTNIAVNVYMTAKILEMTGFAPRDETIFEIAQEVKNEYFPNQSFNSAFVSLDSSNEVVNLTNSLNKWHDYLIKYLTSHPDRLVHWAKESGVNLTIEKVSEKISFMINLSVTVVSTTVTLIMSFTTPGEETVTAIIKPRITDMPVKDGSSQIVQKSEPNTKISKGNVDTKKPTDAKPNTKPASVTTTKNKEIEKAEKDVKTAEQAVKTAEKFGSDKLKEKAKKDLQKAKQNLQKAKQKK